MVFTKRTTYILYFPTIATSKLTALSVIRPQRRESNSDEIVTTNGRLPRNQQGTTKGTLMKCAAYRPPAWTFRTLTQLAIWRTAPERARAIDDPIRPI